MRSRLLALAIAALTLLALICATAGAKTITVAPGANLTTAYNSAVAGDVIELGCGQYAAWDTPDAEKPLTVRAATRYCAKFPRLHSFASNIVFDGLDLDAQGKTPTGGACGGGTCAVFETRAGAHDVVFRNGRIGNVVDQKGALVADDRPTFDNVEFHDVIQKGADVHNECIQAFAPGLTIRNSRFTNCATMDVSIGVANYWTPPQPQYGNVTLINNVFGHSVNGSGWHYYGLAWWLETLNNARVINNTFENAVIMDRAGPSTNGVWANNVGGGWACAPGVTYTGNVGKACSAADKAVSPASSCGPPACGSLITAPFGWTNPATSDFHLTSSSPAVNVGSAQYAPATDRDGNARVGAPDAGAYEFNGGTPPPPPAADTTPPDTTITSGPVDTTTTDATVAFAASEAGATFDCQLDTGAWSACTSPKQYTGLAVGSHTIRVRAADVAGNVDQSPATVTWAVQEPPPADPCAQSDAELEQAQADLAAAQQTLADTRAQLATMTASRDAEKTRADAAELDAATYRARALKAEDQMVRIKAITSE